MKSALFTSSLALLIATSTATFVANSDSDIEFDGGAVDLDGSASVAVKRAASSSCSSADISDLVGTLEKCFTTCEKALITIVPCGGVSECVCEFFDDLTNDVASCFLCGSYYSEIELAYSLTLGTLLKCPAPTNLSIPCPIINVSSLAGDLTAIGGQLTSAIGGEATSILGGATSVVGELTSAAGAEATSLAGAATGAVGDVTSVLGGATSIVGDATSALGAITSAAGPVATAVGDVTSVFGDVTSAGGPVATAVGDVTSVFGDVTSAAGPVVTAVTSAFGDLTSLAASFQPTI